MSTAWDPANCASTIDLTRGFRDASWKTGSSNPAENIVRALGKINGRKVYFEGILAGTSFTSDSIGIGIAAAGVTVETWLGDQSSAGAYFRSGTLWAGGTGSGKAINTGATINSRICCAADGVNGKLWARLDNNGWFANTLTNENPASNIGGYSFASWSGDIFPACAVGRSGDTLALCSHPLEWLYAPPAGFTEVPSPLLVRARPFMIG